MIKKKKIIILLLVCSLIMTACGSSNKNNSHSDENEAEHTQENNSSNTQSNNEKIEITLWHAMGGVNGEATQQLIDDFNASQNEIVVKGEYQGTYDDTITKLKAAMQSGNYPDICQMYDIGTKFMVDSKFTIPVEDMYAKTNFDVSSIMDIITSYYKVDGKQQAMPFNVSTPMLYYNKDVFKTAGLDPEQPPKTYDEILDYAKKIVESKAAAYGFSQAIYGWFFEEQIAGLAQYYANNENGRKEAATSVEFDLNGTGLKVFEMWKKLMDSGYTENFGTTTADTQSAFFAGQTAMMVESTAVLKNATESSGFEIGTGYFPRIEENKDGGVIIGGAALWLMDTKDEKKIDAAWKFIEYCTTKEAQAKWSMQTGYFAINPAAYETEEMKAFLQENPNFSTAINQLKETPVNQYTSGVLSGVATEARLLFNEAMQKTYDNTYTPKEAVDYLAKQINSAIENYNKSIQ